MSTQVAPETQVADAGNPGTADGSPPGGADVTQETREEGAESGAEPGTDRGGVDPSVELARLREQLDAERADKEALLVHLAGERGQPDPEDPIEAVVQKFWPAEHDDPETGKRVRSGWNPAMKELVSTLRATLRAEIMAEIDPKLQGVSKTLAGSKYRDTLVNALGRDVVDSPEFKAFEREYERDPEDGKDARILRDKRPSFAAKGVVAAFQSRSALRTARQQDRKVHEDAKNGRSSVQPSRAAPTTGKTLFFNKNDPHMTEKLLAFYSSGGKRENIVHKK